MVEERNVSYRYDKLDPEIVGGLDIEADALSTNFRYDEAGGMTCREITRSTVTADHVYDEEEPCGDVINPVVQEGHALLYDGENRLRIRRLPDGTEQRYFYDNNARWLAVDIGTSGTATGLRLWFGDEEIEYTCTSLACTRKTEKTYVKLGGQTVARVDKDSATGIATTKAIHTNGLRSPITIRRTRMGLETNGLVTSFTRDEEVV